MADQFPLGNMGAYGAFPPYGFGIPGQGGMYMPAATSMPMMTALAPIPAPATTKKTTKKSAAKKTAKKSPKKPKAKKVAKKPKAKKPKAKKPKKPKKKEVKPKLTKAGKKKKERDPLAPKRARTAFNFFLDEFREQFKIEFPDIKGVVHCTKAGSEKWKLLTPEDKVPYEAKASVAREAYLKAKEAYLSSGGPQKFKLMKGAPRPPTAYFVFLTNFRKQIAESKVETSIKEISKLAGQKWREMAPEDKVGFESKALLAKEEYKRLKEMTAEERVADVGSKNPYARFL